MLSTAMRAIACLNCHCGVARAVGLALPHGEALRFLWTHRHHSLLLVSVHDPRDWSIPASTSDA